RGRLPARGRRDQGGRRPRGGAPCRLPAALGHGRGMMLSGDLQLALNAAMREAQSRRHEYVTVEHVLFALLHDERGSKVLRHAGADVAALKRELLVYFDQHLEKLSDVPPDFEPVPTAACRRIVQRAILHVRSAGRAEADAGDLLVALFLEKGSWGVQLLESQGVSRLDVM